MGSNSLTLAPAPRSEAAEQVRQEVRAFLAEELAAAASPPTSTPGCPASTPRSAASSASAGGWA